MNSKEGIIIEKTEAEINIFKYLNSNEEFISIELYIKKFIEIFNEWEEVFEIENGENVLILLMYTEVILKFRSSILLFKNGCFFEAIGILRSVLEINNKLFGINRKIVNIIDSLGEKITEEFKNMSSKEKYKKMHNYKLKINNKIKTEIIKNLSEEEKNIYKELEYGFNSSLHGGSLSISNRIFAFKEDKSLHNLFKPEFDERYLGIFINSNYSLILMTLKNIIQEKFYIKNIEVEKMIKIIIEGYEKLEEREDTKIPKEIINIINKIY